jgi:drug efflux transport system permease protein
MNKFFSFRRMVSIGIKEIKHVLRDPFTLLLALGLPVILVVFFGFIIDFDYKNIRLSVVDRDNSPVSRKLIDTFFSSGYFKIKPGQTLAKPAHYLDNNSSDGVLIVNNDFGRDIKSGEPAKAQILLDGSDNSKTGVILRYLNGIQLSATERILEKKLPAPIDVQTRFLFNPELNSRWFVIPGLTVIIVGLLSVLLTALTIAREWENGSMELLLSTPVRPLEIIGGKILPYMILGFGGIFFVFISSKLVFGVPFKGSFVLYLLACSVFLLASLSQGVFISVVARQQQIAMQMAITTGLLPAMLLSGFIFPIESMPAFFKYLTVILIPRWFMEISRAIFLKGSGALELIRSFGFLFILFLFLMLLAFKKFKTDLE